MTIKQWSELKRQESEKVYYKKLMLFLDKEYENDIIFPKREDIFKALEWTPLDRVKVVILGQDPYHGENQAHGLSFSVLPGNKVPPSLMNIYKELATDLDIPPVRHGYLEKWAKQGVLLLNTVLTVREGQPNSHQNVGWEIFTDEVISTLNRRKEPVVFVLWGKPSQKKRSLITEEQHYILSAPHPSPLAAYRGFFGSKPFSQINDILKYNNQEIIDWQLEEITD